MPTTKRLNYTGRRRIDHTDARVTLIDDGNDPAFSADLNLQPYDLPGQAQVLVEARAGWTVMRFPFGTVGSLAPAGQTTLSAFDTLNAIRVPIRILDGSVETARVLAVADNIRPRNATIDQSGRSFLEVRQTALGQLPWALELNETPPLLLINDKFDDARAVVRSESFRGLVLPEIYRHLLTVALEEYGEEADGSWQRQCVALAYTHTKRSPPPPDDRDAADSWIDDAVGAFCVRHSILRTAKQAIED